MNNRILLLILLLIVLVGGVIFLLSSQSRDASFRFTQDSSVTENRDTEEAEGNTIPITPEDASHSVFTEILPSDCSNECVNFQGEDEKFRYCQSVCGFSSSENGVSTEAPAYQKSVEQREAAIKNKDLSACSEIKDANLRKSCEVRVTEDMLE